MKDVADALTTSGLVIIDGELIGYILEGVGPEYDLVVVHITSRLYATACDITLGDAKV